MGSGESRGCCAAPEEERGPAPDITRDGEAKHGAGDSKSGEDCEPCAEVKRTRRRSRQVSNVPSPRPVSHDVPSPRPRTHPGGGKPKRDEPDDKGKPKESASASVVQKTGTKLVLCCFRCRLPF
eukprot:TRINITY_DN6735_c0_g2_i1.p1 TRINITY_DN6735_c0_g2~~TRINITY_DN6735_c0_g2_i1.p1  ORF type:complete len:124 (+),score=6.60 TRINITY_DN6735_c0_g2_i1:52-423(+)